jgi:hypothetical protein
METTHCTNCGEEIGIEHELTLFLRWLREEEYIQNNHYMQVVKERNLPDPERLARLKESALLQEIFELRTEIRNADDKRAVDLEAKLEKIEEEMWDIQ